MQERKIKSTEQLDGVHRDAKLEQECRSSIRTLAIAAKGFGHAELDLRAGEIAVSLWLGAMQS